jgi:hypothetical protein
MVQDPIDQRGCYDLVAEHFSPVLEPLVRLQYRRGTLESRNARAAVSACKSGL